MYHQIIRSTLFKFISNVIEGINEGQTFDFLSSSRTEKRTIRKLKCSSICLPHEHHSALQIICNCIVHSCREKSIINVVAWFQFRVCAFTKIMKKKRKNCISPFNIFIFCLYNSLSSKEEEEIVNKKNCIFGFTCLESIARKKKNNNKNKTKPKRAIKKLVFRNQTIKKMNNEKQSKYVMII